jgi:hypothetical protein
VVAGLRVVRSGVEAKDLVIVKGLARVRAGTLVEATEEPVVADQWTPKP